MRVAFRRLWAVINIMCPALCWAAQITADEAASVALAWMRQHDTLDAALTPSIAEVESVVIDTASNVVYVAKLEGGGYVVTASDDRIEPIIAFSDSGEWVTTNENPLLSFLKGDMSGRHTALENIAGASNSRSSGPKLFSVQAQARTEMSEAVRRNSRKWEKLRAVPVPTAKSVSMRLMASNGQSSVSDMRVAPLVKSTWDQGSIGLIFKDRCYNYYTPNGYPCGCVATAMAQVMRYHEYPQGYIAPQAFLCEVDEVSTNLTMQGGWYDWENMTLSPGNSLAETKRKAIGKLTYDAGVAVHMTYASDGSSAHMSNVPAALKEVFGYASAKNPYGMNYSATRANLDAGYPVIWSIHNNSSGHAVVVDGYGYSSETWYVHVNLGWGGSSNAWYNPDDGISSYTEMSGCVYDIFPTDADHVIVSGRVVTEAGLPIEGAWVCGESTDGTFMDWATTNEKGCWYMFVPKTDDYRGDAIPVKFHAEWNGYLVESQYGAQSYYDSTDGMDFVVRELADAVDCEGGTESKGLVFATGSSAPWVRQTEQSIIGGDAAQSGGVGNSGESWMQATTSDGEGKLTFWWNVSSEQGCDKLTFSIDDAVMSSISGTNCGWQCETFIVTNKIGVGESSDHAFNWNYSKDKAVAHGLDCGWVDCVTWQRKAYLSFSSIILPPEGDWDHYDYYYYTNLVAYAGDLHPSAPIPVRAGYTFDGWYNQTWKHDYSGYETNWYSEAVAVTGTVYDPEWWQANWVANTYSIAFDSNCGTGETAMQRFTYDVEQSLRGNNFVRHGYTFLGWATAPTGEAVYEDSELVKNLTAVNEGTVWLYAVWKPNSCVVTFDANGGYGWMYTQHLTHDISATLNKNAFWRTGYHFTGWATSSDGPVIYLDAQDAANLTLSPNESMTLYAVWAVNTYSVTFNAKGGNGIMPPQPFTYGVEQVLQTNAFVRSGYAFAGWATAPDGGVKYNDASKVKNLSATMDANVELFAVWDEDPEPGSYRLYVEGGVLKRWRTDGATDIVIPDGVRVIAPDVFYHTNVTSVTFSDSVESINGWAFANCKLTNIVWGTGLREIGAGAFSFNRELGDTLVLPDGVQSVGSYAFNYCTGLKRVEVPSSVTKMGVGAFMSCSSLQWVTFHGDAPQVQTYLSGDVLNGIYTDTPTSLTTYVPHDSTGWFDESDYKPPMWPLDGSEARALRCSEDWPTVPIVRLLEDEGWGIGLLWDDLPDALSYEVYRSALWWYQPDEVLALGLMNGWFVDTTALVGMSYWYWVAAVDADGTRTYSDAVSGRREVSLSLGADEMSHDMLAGSETMDVYANTSWRAVSSAAWLKLTTSSGNGNGLLSYKVSHNFSKEARDATITVTAGGETAYPKTLTIHVSQSGWIGGVSLESHEYEVVAGVPLSGSEIAPEVAEGYALRVTGLPSGLKFDAKNGTITGVPTAKAGAYTVTFTATPDAALKKAGAIVETTTIKINVSYPVLTLETEAWGDESAAGTVKGGGAIAANKKVTLTATPAKGSVFAGWFKIGNGEGEEEMANGESEALVSMATSYSYLMPAKDTTLVARFVTAEEDRDSIELAVNGVEMAAGAGRPPYQTNIWAGVYMEWPVAAGALSETKVAVAGLPAGLKFTEKPVTSKVGSGKTAVVVTNVPAYTIYGAPTAASKTTTDRRTGEVTVTPSAVKITVTTAGKSSQTYQIDTFVDALPAWAVGTFDGATFGVGRDEARPSQEGGVGRDGTRPSQGDADAQERVPPEGLVTLTVDAKGKMSGKLIDAEGTWTLSAAWFDEARLAGDGSPHQDPETESQESEVGSLVFHATVIGKNGKMATTNEVEVAAEEMRLGEDASPHRRGVVTGGPQSSAAAAAEDGRSPEWTAWQNLWKTEPWKTDAKPFAKAPALDIQVGDGHAGRVTLPDGVNGTITLKFAASGAVTASGKFVTGQDAKGKDVVYSASCSSVLVPEADAAGAGRPPYRVFLYFPPKAGKFEGYADEIRLVWDGTEFSVDE